MTMVLTEEQTMLRKSAADFLQSQSPLDSYRTLRDQKVEQGFHADIWQQMVALGWSGVSIPESYEGLGFGYQGLGLILQEMGKTLCASPLLSSCLMAPKVLLDVGSEAQKKAILPQIASGHMTIALAVDEGPHHDPQSLSLKADGQGDRFSLSGHKSFVMDGGHAKKIIVAAKTSQQESDGKGITLFLLDRQTEGVHTTSLPMVDHRNMAHLAFENVVVTKDNILGKLHDGYPHLEQCLDYGRIGLAAEMLGMAEGAFQMTLGWLKERRQFGVPIGTFQALQHRASQMFCELELGRAVVAGALSALDQNKRHVPLLASLAKAKLGDILKLVTNETIQLHGGIGVTDEHDIGFFLKRSRILEQALGHSRYHRDRYARLKDL